MSSYLYRSEESPSFTLVTFPGHNDQAVNRTSVCIHCFTCALQTLDALGQRKVQRTVNKDLAMHGTTYVVSGVLDIQWQTGDKLSVLVLSHDRTTHVCWLV